MTDSKMARVNLYLPTDMIDRLKKRKDKTGVPVAEFVRRAVQHELDRSDRKPYDSR